MQGPTPVRLAIFDLDNTLWDLNTTYEKALGALVESLHIRTGIPMDALVRGFDAVSDHYRVLEHERFIQENPVLKVAYPDQDLGHLFAAEARIYKQAIADGLKPYEGMRETLDALKAKGIKLVCYSESNALRVAERLLRLGMDGVFDTVYSPRAGYLPFFKARVKAWIAPDREHGLELTTQKVFTGNFPKNDGVPLKLILADQKVEAKDAVMVGDSLVRDVMMAQSVGVRGIYAKYGHVEAGSLLIGTSPWPKSMSDRHRRLMKMTIRPDEVLERPRDLLNHVTGPAIAVASVPMARRRLPPAAKRASFSPS